VKNYFKKIWADKGLLASIVASLLLLAVAFFINYYANMYATIRASNSVADIILSNTRAWDVDNIFVYGPIIFWVIVAFYLIKHPNKIAFTIAALALFIVTRDAFICMTHIGPFPSTANVDWLGPMRFLFSGDDLFFSGHTGAPYLMALVFWDNKYLRYIYIAAAVLFGAVVLLGHLHYTIDVVAAFFITHSIYIMATKIFKKYFEQFQSLSYIEWK
jgi:hypothetical protein